MVSAPTPEPSAAQATASQLVRSLGPLRSNADGTHRISLELHPAELGTVRVLVEMRSGTMHVQLSGGEAARDAMRHALPDLRQQLDDLGITTGSLDVDQGPANQHDQSQQLADQRLANQQPTDRGSRPTDESEARTPAGPGTRTRSGTARALDLSM